MMQIKELIIYGKNGKRRTLPFRMGEVNIITGKSKSGKTAIGAIIEYCLGGTSCNISDGIVRDNSDWYALLLQFMNEQVFIARKNPLPSQQSTGVFYLEVGSDITIPDTCDFIPNQNVEGIEETLTKRLGISENINIPPGNQSRPPLSANIRHALYYCFQYQDEIASPKNLFHRQQEDFITQAIRDTLPYFLGIVNEENLALESERVQLRRQITIEKRRLDESLSLRGGGVSRAISLFSESKEVGLLPKDEVVDFDDYDAVKSVLERVDIWQPAPFETIGMDRLSYLQSELSGCESELQNLNIEIDEARLFSGASNSYDAAVKHQALRLNSIGLFEQIDFAPNHCPFCSSEFGESKIPNVESVKTAIINLNKEIEGIEKERPKIHKHLNSLEEKRQGLRNKIQSIRSEIDGVYEQNQSAKNYQDLMARRARVVGRISLWLESIGAFDNYGGKQETIRRLESRLDEIEKLLNRDDLQERLISALNRIAVDMSLWAKDLKLEHGEHPFRLDMGKVTVVVDKPDRPIPLRQLGSGANWVGVHLVTYFALHKFFIEANRPVPNFIFIDQPSQVYFPSEREGHGQDWDMIRELYNFIFDRVKNLNNRLQVIIVDHASIENKKFLKAVNEDWHNVNDNLIPVDWYTKSK